MNSMSITVMSKIKHKKDTKKLMELGVQALLDNHFDRAATYFKRAALRGNEWANRYYTLLCYEEDTNFARDIIVCAEGWN